MSGRDHIDVATDIACGVGNQFGGHIYEGRDRYTIELGIRRLHAAGYRLIGPDDAKLIQTALEHASFALEGIVALDDEDMGKDGGSATAQHTKRTVDRALKAARSPLNGGSDHG